MRVARSVLSAFLSMALVVGMVPDCAYAKVAAWALHLGTSQASPSGAGDAQQASQDDVASSGEPAPADTGEVADGDAELQSAAPEEGFSYRQVSGGVEVTGYAGDATELSIPEELGGSKVVGIANSALSGHTSLRSVEVPGSVGTLGAHSFDGCTSLASVRLSEGVRRLGALAFQGCSSLASVELPASLESTEGEVPWGAGPFEGSGLASARLAPGSTRVAAGAFRGCSSLASVELPDTVTSVGSYAFARCTSLPAALEVPAGVTSVGDSAYEDCAQATSLSLPPTLSSVGTSAFARCSSLASVEVPGSVGTLGAHSFDGCTSLASVRLSEGVRRLGALAFAGCSSLASVELPASVTSIDDTTFEGCDALTLSCPRGSFAYSWAVEHGLGVSASDGTHALLDPAACSYSARRLDDGLVELTVRWGLAEPSAVASAVTLRVPDRTEVRAMSVCGVEAPGWSLVGGRLTVPVSSPSGEAVALCRLPASESPFSSRASAALVAGGAARSEPIGSPTDVSSPVSLDVPEVTASGTFSVRGSAPAGSRVELRVGGVPAGSATASASGAYEAEVSVSSPVEGWEYAVSASCGDSSARGTVLFDPSSAGVTSFVMRYDGRDHDLLGADSVTLTFLLSSYHGEHPFRFEVAFDVPPERIEVARVVSVKGTERKYMDLTWDGAAGRWVAEGWFDPADHDYVPGRLFVSYRTRPREVSGLKVPTFNLGQGLARPVGWEGVVVARLELPMHTIRYTFTSEDPSSPFSDDSEGPATMDVRSLDSAEAIQAGAPATEEEAKEQGYESVGYTNLPLAAGKVVGSPATVGGPYRTPDGSSWYAKITEGIDGSTALSLAQFGVGVGLVTEIELNTSRGYMNTVGKFFSRCNLVFGVVGAFATVVSCGKAVGRYWDLSKQIDSAGLSDEERAICHQRINAAIVFNVIVVGFAIATVPASGNAAIALGILASLSTVLLSYVHIDSIDDLLKGGTSWFAWICSILDPSGTVVDAATGEPVPGARVTLWYAPLPGVDPEPWDASPWGQENPIATDGGGRFSWEVPEGWWQVRVEAEGYWPAQSEWVRMPAATEPDLQIGLRPASLPQPGGVACADCSVAPGPSARLGRVA